MMTWGDPTYSVVNAGEGFKDPQQDVIWMMCDPTVDGDSD